MPSLDQLRAMLAADPNDPFILYGLAQAHAKAGEHERAVEHYDRCLAADRGYCYAYYHKARSLEALGRVEEAAGVLREGAGEAKAAGDGHALEEISAYLDALSP